jgi:hypothetical protein
MRVGKGEEQEKRGHLTSLFFTLKLLRLPLRLIHFN